LLIIVNYHAIYTISSQKFEICTSYVIIHSIEQTYFRIMRYYKEEIPAIHSNVVAIIVDYPKDSCVIHAILPEYDNMKAYILCSAISKRKRNIGKFLKKRKDAPSPYFIDSIANGIPNIGPVYAGQDWDFTMNNFYVCRGISSLTDDIVFQKLLDPKKVHEQFLWSITSAVKELELTDDKLFSHYLDHLDEFLGISTLSEEDKTIVKNAIDERVESGETTCQSNLHVVVLSSHSLTGLNKILNNLCTHVDALYYQDAPLYKVIVKKKTEDDCKNYLRQLETTMKTFCSENNIMAVIKYDTSHEEIKGKIVRIRPLNKLVVSSQTNDD
jgi:translation initiation factor 2 alpha subunit (eIF-2alpha)